MQKANSSNKHLPPDWFPEPLTPCVLRGGGGGPDQIKTHLKHIGMSSLSLQPPHLHPQTVVGSEANQQLFHILKRSFIWLLLHGYGIANKKHW